MHLKLFRVWTMVALLATGVTCAAHADTVRIRTQFPSPRGDYGTMDAHGNTLLGDTALGATQFAAGGGQVFVGDANAGNTTGTLGVIGLAGGTNHTAAFRYDGDWGVELGGTNLIANSGSIQANNVPGGIGPLQLNPSGGRVGIGTFGPAYALHVFVEPGSGIIPIAITNPLGGATGELEFTYDTAGAGYYANYAP